MDEAQCKRLYQKALNGLSSTKLQLTILDFDRAIKSEALTVEEARGSAYEMLRDHPETRSEGTIEALLYVVNQAGNPPDYGSILSALLLASNHSRHEDIAHQLQGLRDPSSVEALFAATQIRPAYLDYDERFGLARKCIWALADIGTPEAFEKLQFLADGDNSIIAGYARKRIDSWSREKHRKPTSLC